MVLEISRADYAKNSAILTSVASKLELRSKSLRSMTPSKVRFLRPNKVLGGQKVFRDPPKSKKLIFSKTPNSVICPNMGVVKGVAPANLMVSELLV